MQLYKIGRRKGFGLLACLVIVLALFVAFSDIFDWLKIPRDVPFTILRITLAAVVVLVWLVLNMPPPKLPVGKFIIALAEFGEEKNKDGAHFGELRPEPKRRVPLNRRRSDEIYLDDEEGTSLARGKGSRYLESLRQSRRAQPLGTLGGMKQPPILPTTTSKNDLRGTNMATINSLALRRDNNSTSSFAADGSAITNNGSNQLANTNSALVATNEIGEPTTLRPRAKFVRPPYLDDWQLVSGAKEITAFLEQTIIRYTKESALDDLAIFPTDFADEPIAATQLANQNRAHAIIWGWNLWHTRRDFVPVFEILHPLEDHLAPPAGDLQILGLSSFELGLQSVRHSTAFSAFVAGLGAYGLKKFEHARNEFSLALISCIMNEINPRYARKIDRSIIFFFLGNSYYYCGQYDKAVRAYQEVLTIDPELYEARNNMGVALALLGKTDFAIKNFIGVIRDNPNIEIVRFNLGMAYLEKLDFAKSRRELNNAINLNPKYAPAYRGMGVSYFRELQLMEENRQRTANETGTRLEPDPDEVLLYEAAIARLGDALRTRADYAQARIDLGRIRLLQARSGLYDESLSYRFFDMASAELQESIRLDPTLAEGHYTLGMLLRDQDDLEGAVIALKETVRLRPNPRDPFYAKARYALGEIYQQRGQDELAREEFKEATRARAAISPVSAKDYINQGVGLLDNQQYAEAREAFEKALKLEPDNSEAMLNLGAVYQESGNVNQAFTIYQNVLRLVNPPEEIHNRLSRLYQQMGDEQNAFDTIKKAAERNPRSAKLQYWLGNAYRRQKDETQAMACYINAFRIDPDSADARFNLAMIYLGRKQTQDAILQFNEVVRIRPADFTSYIFLGRTYWQMGQTQEAITTLQEAIKIKPDAVEALLTLGQIYQRQADAENAINQFETALTYSPNDLRIRELLASAYALDGKVDLSIEQFQAILMAEASPEQEAQAHYNLGVAYTSKERFSMAAQEFLEYVRLKPADADGYFNLGMSFKNQSMVMEAIQAFSKALELRPNYATAYQMRGQLFIAINDNEKGIADLQAFQNLKGGQR